MLQPGGKPLCGVILAPLWHLWLQIFGVEVGQKAFFDETMGEVLKDVLHGQNWLVYTYGITNSGKTHTIQGKRSPFYPVTG